jgi:hypothetical protein
VLLFRPVSKHRACARQVGSRTSSVVPAASTAIMVLQ